MVSQHFYPDNFRINDIVKMLSDKGHSVTVLTSLPDYETGKVPDDCKGLKNRKTDWFYGTTDYDRKFDDRADRNQYKF